MLEALNRLEDRGIQKGLQKGRADERNELTEVFASLLTQGRNEDLVRAIREPEFLKKRLAEFGKGEDSTMQN